MLTRSRLRHIFARLFRVLASLVVIAYLGQAVLAGQFLSGTYPALRWHQLGATASDTLLFAAVAVGALLRWQAKGRAWPFWSSLGLLVANQVQNSAGAGRVISLHIPLGVAMLAAAVLIAVHSFTTGRLTGTAETEGTA